MLDRQARNGSPQGDRRTPTATGGRAPAPREADRLLAADVPPAIPAIGFSVLGLASTIERWSAPQSEAR